MFFADHLHRFKVVNVRLGWHEEKHRYRREDGAQNKHNYDQHRRGTPTTPT